MTGTWVLRCFSWEACYTHGLFDQYCDILVICMGFKLLCCLFVRCWWYTHGLFDLYWGILAICMGFKLLCSLVVRSWWYTRGLFDLCADILALCMGFKLLCSLCVRSWCNLHGLFDLYSDTYKTTLRVIRRLLGWGLGSGDADLKSGAKMEFGMDC